jgi:hypothetical protein
VLLIAGGLLDPNLQALADAAERLDVAWLDWRVPKDSSPPCHWDLALDASSPPWHPEREPALRGAPLGAFVRQDVFAHLEDPRPEVARRAQGWYTVFQSWLLCKPDVRSFNLDMAPHALNKPAALLKARAAGLRIPPTQITNDTARLRARLSADEQAEQAVSLADEGANAGEASAHVHRPGSIAKPVAGGGLCQTLEDALKGITVDYSAMPAIIQPRLVAPEVRLFVVGHEAHAFLVESPSLDYRAEQDAEVSYIETPDEVTALRQLMASMRMDFGAADFKTDPATGELVFLELNTSPMFARFDHASGGALTESMVKHLTA